MVWFGCLSRENSASSAGFPDDFPFFSSIFFPVFFRESSEKTEIDFGFHNQSHECPIHQVNSKSKSTEYGISHRYAFLDVKTKNCLDT